MTDIQSWRRNTHLSASRIADIAGYGSSPEDISSLTAPNGYARRRPRPRKSLASFASYLGTHRTSSGSKPEWPSIDWPNVNAEDHIYRPAPDAMCTTLQQHVLNNPSTDLPAQYNSFVLHILESYYRSKDDKKELERKLQAEEARRQTDAHEFNLMIQSLSTRSEPGRDSTAELHFPNPTGDMSASSSEKTRKSSSKLDSLLSKFDAGYSRKPKRHDKSPGTQGSQTESMAPSQSKSLRPSSQRSRNASAVVALDPKHNLTLPSPPPSTARPRDFTISSTEDNSTSDEDYPVALTSIAVAAADYSNKGRLHKQQFEHRNEWQSNFALAEPSDNQCNSAGAQEVEGSSPMATMPPESTSITAGLPGSYEASRLRVLKKEPLEDPDHLLDEMRLKRIHRREFSFLPGDDSRKGHSKSIVSKLKPSPDRASTRLVDRKEGKSEQGVSAKAGPRPQLAKAIVPWTEEDKTRKLPHREGSGKSVLTAIKESSSRSSSYSYQDSLGSNDGNLGLTGTRKGLGDNTFAVAAARAARKRQAESECRTNE